MPLNEVLEERGVDVGDTAAVVAYLRINVSWSAVKLSIYRPDTNQLHVSSPVRVRVIRMCPLRMNLPLQSVSRPSPYRSLVPLPSCLSGSVAKRFWKQLLEQLGSLASEIARFTCRELHIVRTIQKLPVICDKAVVNELLVLCMRSKHNDLHPS